MRERKKRDNLDGEMGEGPTFYQCLRSQLWKEQFKLNIKLRRGQTCNKLEEYYRQAEEEKPWVGTRSECQGIERRPARLE